MWKYFPNGYSLFVKPNIKLKKDSLSNISTPLSSQFTLEIVYHLLLSLSSDKKIGKSFFLFLLFHELSLHLNLLQGKNLFTSLIYFLIVLPFLLVVILVSSKISMLLLLLSSAYCASGLYCTVFSIFFSSCHSFLYYKMIGQIFKFLIIFQLDEQKKAISSTKKSSSNGY